ncbi:hypothetical protein JL722_7255 [Aureococcus anophagefferens]|nr:hypothetical protein JL722_7255 [Aureococcus anophagefferens]
MPARAARRGGARRRAAAAAAAAATTTTTLLLLLLLKVMEPRHNYQLWWVQRTRYNFIVQKKKAIRVTEPTCTFDSINDRYFPYTIIRPDGSYIDTL